MLPGACILRSTVAGRKDQAPQWTVGGMSGEAEQSKDPPFQRACEPLDPARAVCKCSYDFTLTFWISLSELVNTMQRVLRLLSGWIDASAVLRW